MSIEKRKKTPVQEAMVGLRRALGLSQEKLAQALGVAWVSVARWETSSKPPSRLMLAVLGAFAAEKGLEDFASVFRDALIEQRSPLRWSMILPPAENALRELSSQLHFLGEEYLKTDYGDWDEAELVLRRLRRLQSAYIKILRALHKAYDILLEQGADKELMETRASLEWLLESEKKKDWRQ